LARRAAGVALDCAENATGVRQVPDKLGLSALQPFGDGNANALMLFGFGKRSGPQETTAKVVRYYGA
jgi:hypothetical protein